MDVKEGINDILDIKKEFADLKAELIRYMKIGFIIWAILLLGLYPMVIFFE
jgi:hypothetical protein